MTVRAAESYFVVFVILTTVLICHEVEASSCPHHVTKVRHGHTAVHNHVCYLFVNYEMYWSKARNKCWDLGGEMLIIDNQETMDFIKKKLNSPEMGWDREGVWLGASLSRGDWRWTNGRAMNYTNWAPGEPSKLLGLFSVEECSQMRQDDGWKWHDIPCGSLSFHYNYVCQFSLNKPGDVAGRVASSAANQAEDNGNSSILALIIGIGAGLLLIMGIIIMVLHLHHRRSKQKTSDTTVHFTNNTYHRTSVIPASPPVPTSQVPAFLPNDGISMPYKEMPTTVNNPLNGGFSSKECNCAHFQSGASNSVCSSPGTGSECGACGGSDPEQEVKVPLMAGANKTNCGLVMANGSASGGAVHCCCSLTQGDYIDMNNLAQDKGKHFLTKEDEGVHLYSNVDLREGGSENVYEVLPC